MTWWKVNSTWYLATHDHVDLGSVRRLSSSVYATWDGRERHRTSRLKEAKAIVEAGVIADLRQILRELTQEPQE